jgi:hypothetical protein
MQALASIGAYLAWLVFCVVGNAVPISCRFPITPDPCSSLPLSSAFSGRLNGSTTVSASQRIGQAVARATAMATTHFSALASRLDADQGRSETKAEHKSQISSVRFLRVGELA